MERSRKADARRQIRPSKLSGLVSAPWLDAAALGMDDAGDASAAGTTVGRSRGGQVSIDKAQCSSYAEAGYKEFE
jgi:hypothetical protein